MINLTLLVVGRGEHGAGGSFPLFLAPPCTPAGCENRTRELHKKWRIRVVRGDAGGEGLIPRSRNMRNQTKARFSHKPNKKIRFKQITKARFKQKKEKMRIINCKCDESSRRLSEKIIFCTFIC
jgi:hypothetical protein